MRQPSTARPVSWNTFDDVQTVQSDKKALHGLSVSTKPHHPPFLPNNSVVKYALANPWALSCTFLRKVVFL
jgi:hypothetical protein